MKKYIMAERVPQITKSIHRILESKNCNEQLIKHCLKFKINSMKILDRRKRSPLHSAARGECSIQIFRLLTKFKEYINYPDHWGFTPLHYAIIKDSSSQVIEELIHMGADVELPDPHKEVPLCMAVKCKNNVETVKILIKAGAKIQPIFNKSAIWWHCVEPRNEDHLFSIFLQDPSILLCEESWLGFNQYGCCTMPKKLIRWASFHDHQYASDPLFTCLGVHQVYHPYLVKCVNQVKELQDFDRTHNCNLYSAVKSYCTLPLHSAEWFLVLDNASDAILDFDRPSMYFEEIAAVQKAFVVRRTYQLQISREGSRPLDLLSSNRVVDFLTSDEDRMNLAVAYDPQLPHKLARNLESMKEGQNFSELSWAFT